MAKLHQQKYEKEEEKIQLVIDNNYRAHGEILNVSSTKVFFLPPNTTSKLQPLHQKFLSDMDRQTLTKINVLDAMRMVTKAWSNVTGKTISCCFKISKSKQNA